MVNLISLTEHTLPTLTRLHESGALPQEPRLLAEKIRMNINIGQAMLFLSGVAVVASVGCFMFSSLQPAIATLVASAVLGFFGQMILDEVEVDLIIFNTMPRRIFEVSQPVGLRNEGNTCFINALFQMIMNDDVLLDVLHKSFAAMQPGDQKKRDGCKAFLDGVAAYQKAQNEGRWIVPLEGKLLQDVRFLKPNCNLYSQEDASEFLYHLLEHVKGGDHPDLYFNQGVEREWEEYRPKDAAEELDLKNQMEQKRREASSAPEDRNKQLRQLLANNYTRLMDGHDCVLRTGIPLVEGMSGQDLLDQTLAFHAHEPGKDRTAFEQGWFHVIKEQTIIETPNRFIFALNRFEQDRKIDCTVRMPEELTVHKQRYRLKSIVVHLGNMSGGHYTACIKKNGAWWYISDDEVDRATSSQLTDSLNKGYMYFYEKI